MSKKFNSFSALVYSTDRNAIPISAEEEIITPEPRQQKLKVVLDKKQRAGKLVTLVKGFVGKKEDAESLCKMLKTKCGVGGSVKDGDIIVQGDYRDKIILLLTQLGYHAA